MHSIPQIKTENVKVLHIQVHPDALVSHFPEDRVSAQSGCISTLPPWRNLQHLCAADSSQRKTYFLWLFLEARALITQKRLPFPLTRSINRMETQCPRAITPNTPSRCWLSLLWGLICSWIPSATSGASVGLTGEANCTGHIHPPLKANMKPQSQQLTAGMEASFRTPVLLNWLTEKKQFG